MSPKDEQCQRYSEIPVDAPTTGGENGLSQRASMLRHTWDILTLGGSAMKQISVYDFYTLGKALSPLTAWKGDTTRNSVEFDVIVAHEQLKEAARKDSPLLPATRTVATNLFLVLEQNFDDEVQMGFYGGSSAHTLGFKANAVSRAVKEFDTVFKNDAPHMTVFAAPQKGIYDTRALITRAEQHLPEALTPYAPEQALTDIAAAGRCLAFEVFTASAFHTWRALETAIGAYYTVLAGKTFEQAKVGRNWGKYHDALVGAGADTKITGNIDHIRQEYRNPVMHPNVNILPDEAFSLFGVGISAITQVLQVIATHPNTQTEAKP
jgi:hypothetical protein